MTLPTGVPGAMLRGRSAPPAVLLAFSDVFKLVMVLILCAIPLIAVLRRPVRGGPLHMGE